MTAELWNGADVRWTGPSRRPGEAHVDAGDRAVVVDAGHYHIGSFGGLWSGPGRARPALAGRGVVIRLSDGSELVVSPRHLELVAPDHPLRPDPEGRHADWWLDQLDPWRPGLRVACFVPRSLPSVCRLLHPWEDQVGQPVRWEDVVAVADVADRAELGRRVAGAAYGKERPVETDPFSEPDEGQLDRHRYQTARRFGEGFYGSSASQAIITTGNNWPDAVTAGGLGALGSQGLPLLLTTSNKDTLHPGTDAWLAATGSLNTVFLAGGRATIRDAAFRRADTLVN